MKNTWFYASTTNGVAVLQEVTLAGPTHGTKKYLSSIQVARTGDGQAVVVIKSGATVLFRIPITAPTSFVFETPLSSNLSEGLQLAVEGQEGTGSVAVFVNAQGFSL